MGSFRQTGSAQQGQHLPEWHTSFSTPMENYFGFGPVPGVSLLRIIYIEQGIVETILASQKQGAVVVAP